MASEIDSYDDFVNAITSGYTLSGVGGALGDSEKIISDKVFGGKFDATKHFAASMAVKVAYVWAGNGREGYTLKTGDGEGKITIDTNASETDRSELNQKALNFQTFHKTARDAARAARDAASGQLVVFESTDKQETLNAILLKLIPEEKKGGRRTRKNVRKNTKKNKKNKNRRSNRRGSKK
jgi:hypothetical protein